MANTQIGRIICTFYEESSFDKELLQVLDKISINSRLRGHKLKELAWEYIKLNYKEELEGLKTAPPTSTTKEKDIEEYKTLTKEEKKEQDVVFTKRKMGDRR